MSRPFLSVVVPCFNSKTYLPKLLQSVVDCQMEDIEVILADDCSTESYQDVVDEFSDKLNIIQCKNDYNCGSPSNGRELGASKASGIYLTFVDHDDSLIPEGIQQFRKLVESENYPEYLCCGIRQVDKDGNTELEKYEIFPFLHGKFFNMDKFYKKCGLHHKKDIKYQEDNWFTAIIGCILIKYNLEPRFEHFCTYAWLDNAESLGRTIESRKATDEKLNQQIFNTNMDIVDESFFKYFDEDSLPYPVACEWMIRELVSTYLDCQIYWQFIDSRRDRLIKLIEGVKYRLNIDTEGILQLALQDDGRLFRSELESTLQFRREPVTPHQRFEEFLDAYSKGGE